MGPKSKRSHTAPHCGRASGKFGGHYLVVAMERPGGGTCADCEYSRVYDLNGRAIATDRDEDGRALLRKVLGGPRAHAFAAVYGVIK